MSKTIQTVDIAALCDQRDRLALETEAFSGGVSRLESLTAELLAEWKGSAAAGFSTTCSADITKLRELLSVMKKTIADCDRAIGIYQHEEDRMAEIISAL